jgi:hypothetical protein
MNGIGIAPPSPDALNSLNNQGWKMNQAFYGVCDTCKDKLTSRYHTFSRNIERHQYGDGEQSCNVVVLRSDGLWQYCSDACSLQGEYDQLRDRGISLSTPGPGPIEPCSKCGSPIDLTDQHIAYEMMELTEVRQPWLLSAEPHNSRTVARLCVRCDGDLTLDASCISVNEADETPTMAEITESFSMMK